MGTRTKVIVMAGTMLGLFTSAMDQTVVSTSMPRIIADLGGFGLFSWVGTGFMLASTATVPVVGKLTDIYGRKPFYMAGIFILILGSALCGSSQNVEQLIAFRVIQGLGAGMIMGIAFAILGDVFTPAERGRWAGLMSAVFASASVLGPLIGGTLTDHVHWRWVFYVNLPLGAIALTVLLFGMPNIRPLARPKLDYRGIVLLLSTVVPLLLAFSWAGSRYDWVSPQVIGFFAWAAVGLVVFTYAELRTEEPLLPMSLFRNRVFAVSALVTLISGVAMMGSFFYIPLFVQGVIGRSATNSGLVVMPMMIAMAIASAIAGQLMSRLGRYRLLGILGLSLMIIGAVLLSSLTVNSASRDVTYAMIVFGVGLGTSMPLFMLAVQNAVPYRFMGISTSTMQFLRSVGGTVGVAVMFSLIQSRYHDGLTSNVPAAALEQPQIRQALNDPQFPLNPEASQRVQQAFLAFGDQGQTLFAQTIEGVRASLATAITDAFLIAVFILIVAVIVSLFMKEIPLRKAHYDAEEAAEIAALSGPGPAPAGVVAAIPPIAGGANGNPLSGGGDQPTLSP
ncbi:MAG TPA: MDR family MFS transporter [Dehalococcoidia bacterium]|nr:MDR family MFS transporter [Dehalococcoidia bacterium]